MVYWLFMRTRQLIRIIHKNQDRKRHFGSKGWRSGESARLPPMWPGFKSRRRRHMWVEFVVCSLLCWIGFSAGTPVFPSPQKPTLPNSNWIWNAWTRLNDSYELLGASWLKKQAISKSNTKVK